MRAIALHADVLVATSAIWQTNCVIVRGRDAAESEPFGQRGRRASSGRPRVTLPGRADPGSQETFVIDSPVLPEELDALPALVEQAGFPAPSGLLATHGDWDHLLGRLAFPGLALGCAESTAVRMQASPGEAQRELRAFDEGTSIERDRPLSLGAVQTLARPRTLRDRRGRAGAASGRAVTPRTGWPS